MTAITRRLPDMIEEDFKFGTSTAPQKAMIADRNIPVKLVSTIKEYFWSANVTAEKEYPIELEEKFIEILALGRNEVFEDGVETEFSRKLTAYIEAYHNLAVEVIGKVMSTREINPEVLSEALRWIGDVNDVSSHKSRREFLESCLLNCRSARERDGAIIGLASMDDPNAIPSLKLAIEKEEVKALQLNMKQVLEQLLETSSEISL